MILMVDLQMGRAEQYIYQCDSSGKSTKIATADMQGIGEVLYALYQHIKPEVAYIKGPRPLAVKIREDARRTQLNFDNSDVELNIKLYNGEEE